MRPRLKPVSDTYPGQHGPHQAAYPWPPLTARAEIECPAPVSNSCDQSAALAAERLAGLERVELIRALDELRRAVVLQPAPQHGLTQSRVGSRVGVVVLQCREVAVVVSPRAAAGMHARGTREHPAVIADP